MEKERRETHEADNQRRHDNVPRRVRLERRAERQSPAVDTLGLKTRIPPRVREPDTEPSHQPRNGGHVREPAEHLVRAGVDTHVRQPAEQGADRERHVRQPGARRACEYPRGVARNREAVERTGGGVQVRGGGGPGGGEERGVDDGGETLDACLADGNDEGRGEGGGLGAEVGVVRGHEEADDECADDVEEQDTDVDLLDCAGDVATRVLGLTGSNGDDFSADEGEGSLGHHVPPSEEATSGATNTVELDEWARVLPVPVQQETYENQKNCSVYRLTACDSSHLKPIRS